MAKDKKKYVSVKTPVGTGKWVFLNEPQTQFDPDGIYKVDLSVDTDEASEFITSINKLVEEAYQEGVATAKGAKKKTVQKNFPYEEEYDEDDNPTGNIIIKSKMKAVYTKELPDGTEKKIPLTPKVFDKFGRKVDLKQKLVYSGSELQVVALAKPYFVPGTNTAGISLGLQAVQVLEFNEGGGKSAEDFGFSVEEAPDVEECVQETEGDDGDF